MSNLENLKKFIGDPEIENKNDIPIDDTDLSKTNNSPTDNEIERNTKMESKACSIIGNIVTIYFLITILLLILCFAVKGPFWGKGIKSGFIFKLLTYDINTILANLMVRFAFLSIYLNVLKDFIVSRMTCRVCSNFFTGTIKVWSRYDDTNVHTERHTTETTVGGTFTSDIYTDVDEVTTYTDNYNVLKQCKYCGKTYADIETKTRRTRSKYSY